MISGSRSNCCLFCASPCSPNFTIINGKLTRLKTEECGGGKPKSSSGSTSSLSLFLEEEENSLLAHQLRVIFIFKNILKIKNGLLINLMRKLDGEFNPEFWIQVCEPCGVAVGEYYRILGEVSKLKKKLVKISSKLITHIKETSQTREDEDETGEEEIDEIPTNVWKEVRQEVLKRNLIEVEQETTGMVENPSFNEKDKKPTEILLEGDIHAAWDEEDGVLSLDVPDLASLKQMLGLDLDPPGEDISHRKVSIQEKSTSNNSKSEGKVINLLQSQTQSNSKHLRRPVKPPLPTSPSSSSSVLRKIQQERAYPLQKKRKKPRNGCYACKQCPYSTYRLTLLEAHRGLHNPDYNSVAITCSICNWVMHPRNLKFHNTLHHPSETGDGVEGKTRKANNNRYYKCPECGALFNSLTLVGDHMKLHEKGEGITCTKCGWLTTNLTRHLAHWHPPEGSSKAELRRRVNSTFRIKERAQDGKWV